VFFWCETWHSVQFNQTHIANQYIITEMFADRTASKGRYSKGYILGVKKEVTDITKVLSVTKEYCILEVNDSTSVYCIVFIYNPPNSDYSLDDVLQILPCNS
jgi:hypothetical protein